MAPPDVVGAAVGSSAAHRVVRRAPAAALAAASALLLVLVIGTFGARAQTDGVTVSATSLTLTELGGAAAEATYTVALATDPTADVTITVASDDPAVIVDTDSNTTGDQDTITFTHGVGGDWATPQTVTVRAANDGDTDNETATISHTAAAASGPYDGITVASVSVAVTDAGAGFVLSETMATVAEAGGTASYKVALKSQPTRQVILDVWTVGAGVSTDVADDALNFSISNWNTAQTVTLTGVNDDIDNPNDRRTVEVRHEASSTDTDYGSLPRQTITVTVTDDDTAGFTISETTVSVAESGGDDSYTVVLDSEPTHSVMVAVSASGSGALIDGPDTSMAFTASETLMFTTSNWNTAQTVNVKGANDDIDNPNNRRTVSITNNPSSSDTKYNALTTETVTATVTDDDTAGITISKNTVTVSEDGATTTDSYTVKLGSQPTHSVSVAVTAGSGAEIDGPDTSMAFTASETLMFTTSNWNTAQTVRVRGANDDIDNPNNRRTVSITNNPSS
ncbi:MAG: hypothetical protein OXI06_08095, partial [bacterium]|nr:hypothetical protein [bacterium]